MHKSNSVARKDHESVSNVPWSPVTEKNRFLDCRSRIQTKQPSSDQELEQRMLPHKAQSFLKSRTDKT
uniref:Uncharacterized protein n=1 Tax=Arundo donax TaxID=35708 RepID=A0A0A9BLK2_ARUDO